MAEEACYRALVNVEMGSLGPELKSQKLYNLGRIKRQAGKFWEAEQLLKQSLSIQEALSGAIDAKVGRRLVELSVSLAAQDRWSEGAQVIERALPALHHFSGGERAYFLEALSQYAKHLRTEGTHLQFAERFEAQVTASK